MKRAVLALLSLALAACAQPEKAAPELGLESVAARVDAGEFGNVHAVLAWRGDELVGERYFSGFDEKRGFPLGVVTFGPDTLHDARSVTKTVVALLFGIAQAEGKVGALDTPVIDSFPDYADLRTPERARIQLGHALAMSSGLAWDEFTYPYQDARNSERLMDAAPDPFRYVLSQPIAHSPGTHWQYSGGDVAVVARAIERGVGMPLDEYAAQKLFGPLGITHWEWMKNRGVPLAASGLRLTPRDMGKIGLLIAHRGAWNGAQIAPAAWVEAMTSPHATVGAEAACGMRYGYFTWLPTICAPGAAPEAMILAIGYGGQRVAIMPARNLVIVTTAGNYADQGQSNRANALLRAVVEEAGR
jgi:CubicO group peptidase (beta-lactamase class C family)